MTKQEIRKALETVALLIGAKHQQDIKDAQRDVAFATGWMTGHAIAQNDVAMAHLNAIRAYLGIDAREME